MAEEMYETLQTQTKKGKYVVYALVCVSLLLLGLTIFTIYYVVENPPNNSTSITLCTTPACVSLADEIISSINTSVDPCQDFYHYSCDGWIERNAWQLIDESEFDQFKSLQDTLKNNFLDELFWYENKKLTAPQPVKKAQIYYATCLASTTSKDDIQGSDLLKELIEMVNFTTPGQTSWTQKVSEGFQEAIAWLNQRDWNSLFKMNVYYKYELTIQQNSDFWTTYNEDNKSFCNVINKTFTSLYMELFNMNQTEAELSGDRVCDFTNSLKSIGDYPVDYLDPITLISEYQTYSNFSNFVDNIVPDDIALNISSIMFKTFKSTNISYVYYYGDPDIGYLNGLSVAIDNADPYIVQLFLFTNVLWYFLDYESSWEQTASVSRSDFCYDWTVDQFPFVFGYITGNTLYNDDKFNAVTELVSSIQNDGISQLISSSSWLSDESRAAAVKKAKTMGLYVGYPDSVFNAANITSYYEDIGNMATDSWLTNVQTMNDWYTEQTISTFTNNVFPILDEWPIIFSQKDAFKYWLTGVNAFYYPGPPIGGANFFVIPTTITQEPFFNLNYPSAVNFGGLGAVCAHEMSHGFDPIGFGYGYNGSELESGSILTEENTETYYEKIQCIIEQYNDLPVTKGSSQLNNGTRTQSENVADDVAIKAAYLAWNTYRNTISENNALPGVDLNAKQLFFWSWAHLWCDTNRPSAYINDTDEHSPHYVRVIGSLQNSQEFADAFNCKDTSYMSPEDKCTLW